MTSTLVLNGYNSGGHDVKSACMQIHGTVERHACLHDNNPRNCWSSHCTRALGYDVRHIEYSIDRFWVVANRVENRVIRDNFQQFHGKFSQLTCVQREWENVFVGEGTWVIRIVG